MPPNRYQFMRRLVREAQKRHTEFPEWSMERLIDFIVWQEQCSRNDAGSAIAAVLAGEKA